MDIRSAPFRFLARNDFAHRVAAGDDLEPVFELTQRRCSFRHGRALGNAGLSGQQAASRTASKTRHGHGLTLASSPITFFRISCDQQKLARQRFRSGPPRWHGPTRASNARRSA